MALKNIPLIPAKAGTQAFLCFRARSFAGGTVVTKKTWVPAFAMSGFEVGA